MTDETNYWGQGGQSYPAPDSPPIKPQHLEPSGQETTPREAAQEAPSEPTHAVPQEPASEGKKRGQKKPGPKPMTDRPTTRFEGQIYPDQHVDLSGLVTRLKMENRSLPASARRRFTINSLVRIGAEIVRDHAENIHGSSEDELLDSLRKSITETPEKRRSRRRPNF